MGPPVGVEVPIFKAERLSRGMNKRSVEKLRKWLPVIMNVTDYYQLGRDNANKTPQFTIGFPVTSIEWHKSTYSKLKTINKKREVIKLLISFQVGNQKVLDNKIVSYWCVGRGIFTCSTCCTLEGELELLGLQTQGQGGWQGDNGQETEFWNHDRDQSKCNVPSIFNCFTCKRQDRVTT